MIGELIDTVDWESDDAPRLLPRGLSAGGTLYDIAPWVVVRTPVLPAAWRIANPTTAAALTDPRVVKALAIGSPDLLHQLRRPDASSRDTDRARRSLSRYLIRMSTRPTPYGAFAGVSMAHWGSSTTLSLAAGDVTRTRFDLGWVDEVLAGLAEEADVRTAVRWRAAPLAYELHGRFVTGPSTASVAVTEASRVALAAAPRWKPHSDLLREVCIATGGSGDDVDRVLTQMWRAGLFELDLAVALTGPSATSGNAPIDVVRSVRPELADRLAVILDLMRAADLAPISDAEDAFATLNSAARDLTRQSPHHHARLSLHQPVPNSSRQPITAFQADLARSLTGDRLNYAVGKECARAAELLLRLSPTPSGSPDIIAYTLGFARRYGPGCAVPILELFDPVSGLGPMPHTHRSSDPTDPARAARRGETLMSLALSSLRDGCRVVDLDRTLIDQLQTWEPSLVTAPLSLDLNAVVVAPSRAALDTGEFSVVLGQNIGSNSAGRWLGRFADMFGSDGSRCYVWLDAAETEAEGADHHGAATESAEVVYQPSTVRMANVVVRPILARHEIPVSGRSGIEQPLELSDLVVELAAGRLRLRSMSLNAVLRPTSRHMLNNHGAPAVAQFLDALIHAGQPDLAGFDWGPAESLPVLPRVQWGRVVLAPARWLVSVPPGQHGRPPTANDLRRSIAACRERWGLPNRCYVSSFDNRLLLDLDVVEDMEQLAREVRNSDHGVLRLQEALPDIEDAWMPGPDGTHLVEIVVSLVRRPAAPSTQSSSTSPSDANARTRPMARTHVPVATIDDAARPPGTDWLFAKFYAPPEQFDALLTGPLADLTAMAENSGLARRWFFIRYADPEPHLRLRWQGDPDLLLRHLLPQVTDFGRQLVTAGRVTRVALDTYERELARYGGPVGLMLCEDLFHIDSRTAQRLLAIPSVDPTDRAAASITALLAGLGLSGSVRQQIYERQVFDDPTARRLAGDDYRVRKVRLRQIVTAIQNDTLGRAPFSRSRGVGDSELVRVASELRKTLSATVRRLYDAQESGQLSQSVQEIWTSLVHMNHNRLVGLGGAPSEAHLMHLLLRTEVGLQASGTSLEFATSSDRP